MIHVLSAQNVVIQGGTLRGDSDTSSEEVSESNHGIRITAAQNVSISGTRFEQLRGDGLYITQTGGSKASSVNVSAITSTANRRHGATVVAADNVHFSGCNLSSNGMTGLDIETEFQTIEITGITVTDCTLNNNGTNGLQIDVGSGDVGIRDVTVTDTTMNTNADRGLSARRGNRVTLTDCEMHDNGSHGAYLELTAAYTLDACALTDNPTFDVLWTNEGTTDGAMLDCIYNTLSIDPAIPDGEVSVTP